jgi:hypothetical protein
LLLPMGWLAHVGHVPPMRPELALRTGWAEHKDLGNVILIEISCAIRPQPVASSSASAPHSTHRSATPARIASGRYPPYAGANGDRLRKGGGRLR